MYWYAYGGLTKGPDLALTVWRDRKWVDFVNKIKNKKGLNLVFSRGKQNANTHIT